MCAGRRTTLSCRDFCLYSCQAESAKLALEREAARLANATLELRTAQEEAQHAHKHLQHRLALARWQFAGAAVSLPNPQALFPSMPARPAGQHAPRLVRQAQALERMTAARCAAHQQLDALRAERAVKKGVANLRPDGGAGDAFSAAVRVRSQIYSDSSLLSSGYVGKTGKRACTA